MSPENPRPRTDTETRKRLTAIHDGYNRWTRKTMVILSVLLAVQLPLAVISVYLLDQNSTRVDDIQQSRKQVTMETCESQNERNRNTVKEYDNRIKQAVDSGQIRGERLKRLKESRDFTVGLVNRLAPLQDCRALVRKRFPPDK